MPFTAPESDLEAPKSASGFTAPASDLMPEPSSVPDFSLKYQPTLPLTGPGALHQPGPFGSGYGPEVPLADNPDAAGLKAFSEAAVPAADYALHNPATKGLGVGLDAAGKILRGGLQAGLLAATGNPDLAKQELMSAGDAFSQPAGREPTTSPYEEGRQSLPLPARMAAGVVPSLVQTAPQLALTAIQPELGAASFGLTPEGFDPVTAATMMVAPQGGKILGGIIEKVAAKAGISSAKALDTINRAGGAAGVAGVMSAPSVYQISQMPAGEERDKAIEDTASNAILIGLLGTQAKREQPAATAAQPKEPNAETIRGNPGQLRAPREVVQAGQEAGGNDVEQKPPGQSESVETRGQVQPQTPRQPIITPHDLQPAFRAGENIYTDGETHNEIISNARKANPDDASTLAILEAQTAHTDPNLNPNRGFIDKNGNWYSRQEATDALNKSNPDLRLTEPLQSEKLKSLKEQKPISQPEVEAAKNAPAVENQVAIPPVQKESGQPPGQSETVEKPAAEIPLGLNRPNLTDESLSKMTDDEFDSHFKNAKQAVNAAEKQLDNAFDAGKELTPDQRKQVAAAQDVWSAADNERFRRNNSDTHTEDIFHKMIDLADVGNDYSKFKILADILTKRGGAKPKDVTAIYNSLPERLKANPDFKEALSGKLGKFKEWLQKYHSEKSPKVEGAPEKVSEAKEPAETIPLIGREARGAENTPTISSPYSFGESELSVSKPQTTRKTRESGTDITTKIDVQSPIEVTRPENWSHVNSDHLKYTVEARGDFTTRKPAGKNEPVWRVYNPKTKEFIATGLTQDAAISLAKKEMVRNNFGESEKIETTPLDPATGNPVEQKAAPVQKFRVGRGPQLYSMVEKIPQTEIEKSNGEQAVTVRNDKTGETHVVMESDLTPVNKLTGEKSKKASVEDKLKALGYTVGQIKAMSKAGAKALADRGQEIIGMGGAIPAEFTDANRDIYGIAERVRRQRENAEMTAPTTPGKGIAPEASVDRGRQLLKAGADPEKVMSDFEKTQRASSDDFAIARAHGETLARITNRTEENFGTDSPEFRAAYKTESDWAARTKAMQTEWAKSGHAQQGETDIDTGTFLGIKRAYRDSHDGHDLPEKYNEKAQRLADENRRLENENARLLKQLNDKLEKEVPPVDKLVPEMAPTVENTRAALSDYKGGEMTKPQVRALWNYTRKNYVNKGNADFSDIVRKVSTDLGMSFKDVANGLAQPAGAKKLTDELWRKQTDARRVKESAKRWVRQINSPILGNIIPWLARKHFGAKVFGHGGVAFGTHAPMVAFIPKYWKTYFQDYKKMWAMNFSPARYEMEVQSLRSDPNFNTAARAGLVNDPYKVEDFNNPDMTGAMGSSGTAGKIRKLYDTVSQSGNRGYFALKLLRQDMFNQGWDTLPESIKTPEMAKAMADDINHITGVVKSSVGGNKASLFFFAPRLLMSRAAFLAGDPYKAVEITTTAMSPAKWKALPPEQKFHVINQVKQKATILAVAYGLLEANKYLLQAVGSKQQINTTDPTRSDFMKFKGAGMDFSYGNAMLNMARLPVRLWTIGEGDGGKLKHVIYPDESMYSAAGEFLRSQASPLAGLGLDLIFKGDYQNRPLPQIPGYGAPIPVPKRLKAQGVGPYTWPEFFAQQVSPIPFQEAEREIWRSGFGLSDEQQKSLLKAAGTTMVMMGTGGRLTEDLQPH